MRVTPTIISIAIRGFTPVISAFALITRGRILETARLLSTAAALIDEALWITRSGFAIAFFRERGQARRRQLYLEIAHGRTLSEVTRLRPCENRQIERNLQGEVL